MNFCKYLLIIIMVTGIVWCAADGLPPCNGGKGKKGGKSICQMVNVSMCGKDLNLGDYARCVTALCAQVPCCSDNGGDTYMSCAGTGFRGYNGNCVCSAGQALPNDCSSNDCNAGCGHGCHCVGVATGGANNNGFEYCSSATITI